MTEITKQEEGTFLMLFNRNGYVLNFSTNDFDVFTTNSIGEALCAKYGLSKWKSLIAYLNSATDENRFKLLSDLFHYYEDNMEYEYNEDYEDNLYWGSSISRYDKRYARIYKKCKTIIDRLEERHAKLAVGSSITFVDFIWSTYEKRKQIGRWYGLMDSESFCNIMQVRND